MSLHREYRFVATAIALTAAMAIALACAADAQTSRGAASGRYEPGASLGGSSPPPLTAPLNTARPVPNPAAPTTPRSYQRDYPRESTPLNPPDYRRFDLPGEWRD